MATILGVLGARNALSKQIMQDEILTPILDDLEKKPQKALLPAEPLSSAYIECWAERAGIEVNLIKSDWVRNGRRATYMRDTQIEKESTVFLVFEGPKSRYYLDLAERLARKYPERPVYVVAANTVSPVLLEVEESSRYTVSKDAEAEILAAASATTATSATSATSGTAAKQTTLDSWKRKPVVCEIY